MRALREYGAAEWRALKPLREIGKQLRNDVLLQWYLRMRPAPLAGFLDQLASLRDQHIALVIAFEQPWALAWQLRMAARHVPTLRFLVFDNSRRPDKQAEIAAVCSKYGVPHLLLPRYRTRHVNRSHGMAMSWIDCNVVRPLQPASFTFLDHDLIPVAPVDPVARRADQVLWGPFRQGRLHYWSIWAGYCAFDTRATNAARMNYLYDFSRELDTGGRNWEGVYALLNPHALRFAADVRIPVRLQKGEEALSVQLIDGAWIHLGGIGYNPRFLDVRAFFEQLACQLESGVAFEALCEGCNLSEPR